MPSIPYGHELQFGTFVTPVAQPPLQAVNLAVASEQAGLDLVTFQDHPYQAAFLDTWTLLTFAAARTERIRLSGNVLNLPLRPPAVLARAAASLDRLSNGRFEMGIGAGAFWDAISAMGGPRRTPGESIAALEDAIGIMRQTWDTGTRGPVRTAGEHYAVSGMKRGPAPAHEIGVWIGAYKPRMLALTGRVGDGWLPSLAYLPEGLESLTGMNRIIDEAAEAAGRDPSSIRRFLNVGGQFSAREGGFLVGPPEQWARQLAEVAETYGISGFILQTDSAYVIEAFGAEVAPATRELVDR